MKTVGMLVTLMAMAGFAAAGTQVVPEIDANSVSNGLALVTGVILVARARKNR